MAKVRISGRNSKQNTHFVFSPRESAFFNPRMEKCDIPFLISARKTFLVLSPDIEEIKYLTDAFPLSTCGFDVIDELYF